MWRWEKYRKLYLISEILDTRPHSRSRNNNREQQCSYSTSTIQCDKQELVGRVKRGDQGRCSIAYLHSTSTAIPTYRPTYNQTSKHTYIPTYNQNTKTPLSPSECFKKAVQVKRHLAINQSSIQRTVQYGTALCYIPSFLPSFTYREGPIYCLACCRCSWSQPASQLGR